jgi:hypothetical protein
VERYDRQSAGIEGLTSFISYGLLLVTTKKESKMTTKEFQTYQIRIPNKRKAFNVLTQEGFEALIKHVCEVSAPADVEVFVNDFDNYTAKIDIDRSFTVGATLYVDAKVNWSERVIGQDDQGKIWLINKYIINIHLNWSSTGRDLVAAAAAVNAYRELIDLGLHIDVALRRYDLALLQEADEQPSPSTAGE